MASIKELSEQTGKPVKLLRTAAMQYGFNGSDRDELPADIVEKLTGTKQLGAAPPKQQTERRDEPTKNAEASKEQGLDSIHAAYFASTQNLQDSHFETEKQIAIAQGKMEAHQIYLNRVAARNQTLQDLTNRDLGASVENWQTAEENYRAYIEGERQKALSAWAASDKTGKNLKQAAGEVRALIASFDI